MFFSWLWCAQCNIASDDGLVKIIYEKMGGITTGIRDGCSIPGVKCVDSKVVEVNWSDRGLTGPIPPEIGNLYYLKEL